MYIQKKRWLIIGLIFIPAVLLSLYIWYISFTEDHTVVSSQSAAVTASISSDEIMDVQIEMDPDDFQNMLDTAMEEQYTSATVVINGERFENVGIRPKGNSTLTQIVNNPNTDRFSFKIKLDEYIDGQNYQGMTKIVLNNNMSDTTYLKEFMSYELMEYMNVPTPMHAFSNISVNGETWGLYLFVEPIEESFIERVYQTVEGNLYKPESKYGVPFDDPEGDAKVLSLVYQGEDVSLYEEITSSAVFKQTNTEDYNKLINFIRTMDTGENLESVMNVEEFARYFAVNTFLVNLDHYSGHMLHNYYLYENQGVFEILPWDYNLSFGTFEISAAEAINFPIDKPTTENLQERPLINSWLQNETYRTMYHTYLADIASYVESGQFEKRVLQMNERIAEYVKNDPTAFYTYEEYETGIEQLLIFAKDRTQSILAQLEGSQPSDQTGTLETTLDILALGDNGMGKFYENLNGLDSENVEFGNRGGEEKPPAFPGEAAPSIPSNKGERPAAPPTVNEAEVPSADRVSEQATDKADTSEIQIDENKAEDSIMPWPDEFEESEDLLWDDFSPGPFDGYSMEMLGSLIGGAVAIGLVVLVTIVLKRYQRKKYE